MHMHVFMAFEVVVAQIKEDGIAREHQPNRGCAVWAQ